MSIFEWFGQIGTALVGLCGLLSCSFAALVVLAVGLPALWRDIKNWGKDGQL